MDVYERVSDLDFEAFKQGSEKAFKLVYTRYYPIISAYIFRFSGSITEAEDIAHESFINLFLNREKINESNGIYPYLFTIAKRSTISNFRKKVSKRRYEVHLEQVWTEESSSMEQQLWCTDLQRVIDKVVNELPTKQKEVFVMNKSQELSYSEISSILGISVNTVKNHLISATRKLRASLAGIYTIVLFFFC
ncbi:MAG: RNA polymerase sigma-70 factor [Pedobacter sp.]|nr:MAG: RNA polymerase sigma-70 factor [Pedobacter sp.]